MYLKPFATITGHYKGKRAPETVMCLVMSYDKQKHIGVWTFIYKNQVSWAVLVFTPLRVSLYVLSIAIDTKAQTSFTNLISTKDKAYVRISV